MAEGRCAGFYIMNPQCLYMTFLLLSPTEPVDCKFIQYMIKTQPKIPRRCIAETFNTLCADSRSESRTNRFLKKQENLKILKISLTFVIKLKIQTWNITFQSRMLSASLHLSFQKNNLIILVYSIFLFLASSTNSTDHQVTANSNKTTWDSFSFLPPTTRVHAVEIDNFPPPRVSKWY